MQTYDILVSNVPKSMPDAAVRGLFSRAGHVTGIRPLLGKDDTKQFFVSYSSMKDAENAIQTFDNHRVDSHVLFVRLSNRTLEKQNKVADEIFKLLHPNSEVQENATESPRSEDASSVVSNGMRNRPSILQKIKASRFGWKFLEYPWALNKPVRVVLGRHDPLTKSFSIVPCNLLRDLSAALQNVDLSVCTVLPENLWCSNWGYLLHVDNELVRVELGNEQGQWIAQPVDCADRPDIHIDIDRHQLYEVPNGDLRTIPKLKSTCVSANASQQFDDAFKKFMQLHSKQIFVNGVNELNVMLTETVANADDGKHCMKMNLLDKEGEVVNMKKVYPTVAVKSVVQQVSYSSNRHNDNECQVTRTSKSYVSVVPFSRKIDHVTEGYHVISNAQVMHSQSPDEMYIAGINPSREEQYKCMMIELNELNAKGVPLTYNEIGSLSEGAAIVAPFGDELYRAIVRSVKMCEREIQLSLFYLDYGNEETIRVTKLGSNTAPKLFQLPKGQDNMWIPAYVLPCRLRGSPSAAVSNDSSLVDRARGTMTEYVKMGKVTVLLNSQDMQSEQWIVDLLVDEGPFQGRTLCGVLVDRGLRCIDTDNVVLTANNPIRPTSNGHLPPQDSSSQSSFRKTITQPARGNCRNEQLPVPVVNGHHNNGQCPSPSANNETSTISTPDSSSQFISPSLRKLISRKCHVDMTKSEQTEQTIPSSPCNGDTAQSTSSKSTPPKSINSILSKSLRTDTKKADTGSHAPRPNLPVLELHDDLFVVLAHIVSPKEFYLTREIDTRDIRCVESMLSSCLIPVVAIQPVQGEWYMIYTSITKNAEQRFARCQLMETSCDGSIVQLLDYGNVTKAEVLYQLPKELRQYPPFAVRCSFKEELCKELETVFTAELSVPLLSYMRVIVFHKQMSGQHQSGATFVVQLQGEDEFTGEEVVWPHDLLRGLKSSSEKKSNTNGDVVPPTEPSWATKKWVNSLPK